MILKFHYQCRWCRDVFVDASLPEIEAANLGEAEMIREDSIRQNPIAKKRAALYLSHYCQDETVGIGDLIGYKMYQKEGVQQSPKVLSIVKPQEGETE